jgi:ParB family transcriptional regulator, chromosome partitioning protein
MPRHETRDPKTIKPNPNQPRKDRQADAFDALVESVCRNGVIQPPGILEDGMVLFGWGRVLAAIKAGLREIPVLVFPQAMAQGQQATLALTENLVRSDLTGAEVLLGFENALQLGGLTQKQLAASLGLKEPYVSRYLTVGKNPLTREPFLAGRINVAHAYQVASAAPDLQQGLLGMALAGNATREDLARVAAGRKREIATAPAVKLSRTVVPLPGGARVQVSGPEMDMDQLIEALSAALDAARRANKDRLDIKTFARVASDKAKAGA